jgi:lambda repressor-like predicted transcriptional regulator
MARPLSKQTWAELRRLFVAGWSLGKLAKRFGVPKGTLCARAAKERWSTERIEGQTLHDNQITLSDDPRMAEIQTLVHDCKLAALEAEGRTAKALARKAAKAVETIEINSMDGITAAQTYRTNLWPSVSPSIKPALNAAQRGERLVVSEETKKYVEQLKTLM